uniref:Carbonic anhydrase XVb n=1 Tax=Neogobius melanostomus TaxID=47308 RepID=A0A8C6WW61_9GOBI
MIWLVVSLVLCVIAPAVQATEAFGKKAFFFFFSYCFSIIIDCGCFQSGVTMTHDATWPSKVPQFCNGSRQSPINIVTQNASVDNNLTAFTFTKFDSKSVLTKIENTGDTVKVNFDSGVRVSGGNLPGTYDSLQFHLHWGNGASVPGSEHTVDGKRFPMEFHIVSIKSSSNGNTTTAVADSTGVAALGFFIEFANMTKGISLDDLLTGVNRARYYRYLGSLTTPLCYEAVVWTVFKEPVKVSKDLVSPQKLLYLATICFVFCIQHLTHFPMFLSLTQIDMFANTVRIGNSTSAFMRNVYRSVQPAQPVTQSSSSKMNYSYGLFVLIVALWMR